jgi:mannose-6-phosphate isomerase-like protein (cupin superfamily)
MSVVTARVRHTDPARFESAERAHGGAGRVHFQKLLEADGFSTPFMALYPAVLPAKTSLGHHFHHSSEEVYVILDESAEFTVNGRTALLQGPAGAPCRLGDSHGIYNRGERPVRLVVFAVSLEMGSYDTWDLGDDRADAILDSRPVFLHFAVDRSLLAPAGTEGARSRRLVPGSVFATSWSCLDHVLLEPGAELPAQCQAELEHVYLVIGGEGSVTIEEAEGSIRDGDVIPVFLGERHSLRASASAPLELLVAGIAHAGTTRW